MSVVQKTFAFAADAEGLVDQSGGGQAAIFAHEPADGNPSGSVKWTQSTKGTTQSGPARHDAGLTWESWGVPAGATVNSVRVVSYSRKVAANAKLSAHSHRIRIVDPATPTTFVHGATNLSDETLPTATGGWLAGGGIAAAQSVTASYQASSSGVSLEHHYTVTTLGGGGSASVDARFDQIVIEIDYTEAAGPITGSGGVTFGFATAGSGAVTVPGITGTGSVAFGFSTAGSGDYTAPAVSGSGGVAFGVSTAGSGAYVPPAVAGTGSVSFGFSLAGSGSTGAATYTGSGGVAFGVATAGSGTYTAPAVTGSGSVAFDFAMAGEGTYVGGAQNVTGSGGVAFGAASAGTGAYVPPAIGGTGGVMFGIALAGSQAAQAAPVAAPAVSRRGAPIGGGMAVVGPAKWKGQPIHVTNADEEEETQKRLVTLRTKVADLGSRIATAKAEIAVPYQVVRSDRCPTAKPFGVVKVGETKPRGCHPSREDAMKQQRALYAAEPKAELTSTSSGMGSWTFHLPHTSEPKAELTSRARTALPDSAFACPEKRLYPHHRANGDIDLPHLRNALSRIGDQSNDQCGKAHLMAHKKAMGIGDTAGLKALMPMTAQRMDPEQIDGFFAGKLPWRVLAVPFGGPIPNPKAPRGVDLDGQWFSERTDIYGGYAALKADRERLVDWHHGYDMSAFDGRRGDPMGVMNGVALGKAILDREPSEDGWWADFWARMGEARLSKIQRLVERGVQLFGSGQPTHVLDTEVDHATGEITRFPLLLETISTSPQNTYSVVRPKALLDDLDAAELPVSDAMRDLLTELDAVGAELPLSFSKASSAEAVRSGEVAVTAEGVLSPAGERALDSALAAWREIPDTLR